VTSLERPCASAPVRARPYHQQTGHRQIGLFFQHSAPPALRPAPALLQRASTWPCGEFNCACGRSRCRSCRNSPRPRRVPSGTSVG